METTIKSKQAKTSFQNEKTSSNSTIMFWKNIEFYRYGIISMLILFIGCVGGFAAAFGAQGDAFKLALVVFPTIIALAFILAVSPMKFIIYLCSIAIIIDAIVLIF